MTVSGGIWLFKTEPTIFSIDDLQKKGSAGEFWDGVRNYQARNFLRDQVQSNDQVLIYHSNSDPSGIVGLAHVINGAQVDLSAFDQQSKYFDPQSVITHPRWYGVTIRWFETFPKIISLAEIKAHPQLSLMAVAKKGQRLSIMPVAREHFQIIVNY